MDCIISPMTVADWPAVREIYMAGIATGQATFQTEAPEWTAWNEGHLEKCRLTARLGDQVAGWVALSLGSKRPCYAGVAEVSIYISPDNRGQGIGDQLMKAVIAESEQHGIWTLWSSVFPENLASIRLHLRNGFREVGRRERIAQLQGKWRDTVVLERRSRSVGCES